MRSGNLDGLRSHARRPRLGQHRAAACDWDDCDACGGSGCYAASAYYGYHARPAYAYVPEVYYAPSAYAYYAPAYYAPSPAYYAPAPAYYALQPTAIPTPRPYYGWRGGYVDAAGDGPHKGPMRAAIPTARGTVCRRHQTRATNDQSAQPKPRHSGCRRR